MIPQVVKSSTTQTVAASATAAAAIIQALRTAHPAAMFWPVELDIPVAAVATGLLSALFGRVVAKLRGKLKKGTTQP